MGRLASVCEVSGFTVLGSGATPGACGLDIGANGFLTTYTYDALSNLTSVSQGGYLPRSFTYDSLSRLECADNPEVQNISCWQSPSVPFDTGSYTPGTIRYGYDANSNVTSKIAPMPNQTTVSAAKTVTATMTYDALNRLLTKSYANNDNTANTTPAVTFNYDQTSALGVSGLLNTIGRSSSSVVSGSQAGEVFSYDQLGRVKNNSQCTPQNCGASAVFPVAYTYDLLGDALTATNGTGVTLTYAAYNRALRIMGMNSSLSDSNHPGTLYSVQHYNAAGSVTLASVGNSGGNVSETRTYDGRLRLTGITDSSVYSISIPSSGGYAPDSDILQAVDSANTTWSYSYDEMNRLCNANHSATFPTCHQGSPTIAYGYDRFGNMWQGDGGLSISFSGNNNRIDGLASHYDAAGNLLYDGATTYAYDSESRIISAVNGSGTSSYLYDANGRRIRKTTPAGETVDFLYDLSGHEISQITSAGAWTRGEIYAGGRHLGTYSGGTSGTTTFTFSDWLGTERARSSPGATTACETITSLPFGDALTTNGSCGDPSPMHFTGKERDNESGLDNFGARYDSSQYGRFMTPDKFPVALTRQSNSRMFDSLLSEPQNWNEYSYAHNNPILKTDIGGLLTVIIPGTHWSKKDWNTNSNFYKQVSGTFHEQAVILDWSGDLSGKARTAGANQLNDLIKQHKFAPGEKLNIVAHSHGGNVAFEASHSASHKIDNLVTLGTPIRGDDQPDMKNIGTLINVWSPNDAVQTSGGGWIFAAGRTLPEDEGEINVEAPEASGHSDLWQNPAVWTNQVSPILAEEANRQCVAGNRASCRM